MTNYGLLHIPSATYVSFQAGHLNEIGSQGWTARTVCFNNHIYNHHDRGPWTGWEEVKILHFFEVGNSFSMAILYPVFTTTNRKKLEFQLAWSLPFEKIEYEIVEVI